MRGDTDHDHDGEARLLAAIVQATSDTVLSIDRDGIITSFNTSAGALFRCAPETMIGRPIQTIAAGAQLEQQTDMMQRVLAGEHVCERSTTRTRADGSTFDVSITSSPLRNAAGEIVGACAVMRDVTERVAMRREIEQQRRLLAASQKQFWYAFEASVSPMWISSLEGGFLRVNDAACDLLRHGRERLEQLSYCDVLHHEEHETTSGDIARTLSGERRSYRRDKRLVRSDGSVVWVDMAVTLIHGENAAPTHWIVQAQDITERHREQQRLQHMAAHDPLTGLLNRRGFDEQLRLHFMRHRQDGPPGALLMIDLDNFKTFNDAHGHAAGDMLISAVAIGLRRHLRSGDLISRIGGDEFAVLLPDTDGVGAEVVANALRKYVRDDLPNATAESNPQTMALTASIGVYSLGDEHGLPIDEAMDRADQAMYDAKRQGRDAVVAYNTSNR
jgi:diguanylate cyclase (GGDEF)-like protein/PAS domain S-box-containing protein